MNNLEMKKEQDEIKLNDNNINAVLARIDLNIDYIKNELKTIRDTYVSKQEFYPVKTIAYSITGAFGMTILVAIANLIINK